MDRTEIDSLIKSVSEHGTLATAKEFFQNLQSVLTGEKFSGLPANKKLLLTVALAIEYGRKKAAAEKQDTAQPQTEFGFISS